MKIIETLPTDNVPGTACFKIDLEMLSGGIRSFLNVLYV